MSEFRSYACWSPDTVRRTIFSDVGAMGLEEDALFLATHVSLPVERLKPSRALVDEREILGRVTEALAGDKPEANARKNVVIAITGPSGSGKSHLVRWVRAQLDTSDPAVEV